MKSEKQVLGLFGDESLAADAVEALAGTSWAVKDVHTPVRSDKILRALKVKKSKVGYFTLAGGIIGFLSGFGLAMYTGLQWNLIVSGKPVVAWIPYMIVGFEFTVLFAVLGNVLGLLMQTNLPEFQSIKTYDPRCSGDYFGILASCPEGQQDALAAFFRERGGEVQLV
jgi:molybdopterin-containing oxidoreductase family membrane subunit